MGKASEYLVASVCILATRGRLNVSTSLVDDDGVDLVFHLRNCTATLAVQVKARMADTTVVQRGRILASVQNATFRVRDDFELLFLVVDSDRGVIDMAWLVPSADFARLTSSSSREGKEKIRFSASTQLRSNDKWSAYRLSAPELPIAIVDRLLELERSVH